MERPAPQTNVAVVLFREATLLDFAGPYQVFDEVQGDRLNVYTVAETTQPLTVEGGMIVVPSYSFEGCPKPDWVVVPGGRGTRDGSFTDAGVRWLKAAAEGAEVVMSVCTGALVLGRAGLLDGLEATTHHDFLDVLRQVAPACRVQEGRRVVDNGRVVTAAGVTAGIDAALHVLAKFLGPELAKEVEAAMEYPHFSASAEKQAGGGG
ncbi:unnamed protein product [Ostreobium quekettii]|uniref:DJ-1/PfpI domain-containing protein n=1 Tax=Ostreobium quekettii TaxID=121088 RepID=A0A8S1J9R4_9CHLO|nr:unnamed protein product [Ostreobium quekettii]|eukprot:evm.model.scf_64.12 EVM.evm.TU.scf_64.12   scf_64:113304-114210(+)